MVKKGNATPTSHIYFSQRLRLHYLDWGNPEAPPLLLVHGHRDHCHNWDWVAEALRDEYHIVAPDFRGHGDSAWVYGAAYSHGEYIYDLAQLIHQLELSPVTIIAHSLGGSVALRYAGIYPENFWWVVFFWFPAIFSKQPAKSERTYRPWFWLGMASYFLAFIIWETGKPGHPLCDPDSIFQAHAAWHLMTAFSTWCFFLFYRTEKMK